MIFSCGPRRSGPENSCGGFCQRSTQSRQQLSNIGHKNERQSGYCATAIRSNIYASMKAAIIALTTTTASEYAPYGIRINAVMPGYTRTPLMDSGMFTPEVLEPILRNNILGRMAEPEEIAKPIVFLASEAASYITASAVDVTGGHMKVINAYEAYERMN